MIHLAEIHLHKLKMSLQNPFQTSFGTVGEKVFFIIEIIDKDGIVGWGESVAFESPWYTEETVKTTEHIITDFLIPLLWKAPISHPKEINERFSVIQQNNMAKAALEGAIWDLYAQKQGTPLSQLLGGTKKKIDVGVSIGIQKNTKELLNIINHYVTEGYRRIKIKIKPNYDVAVVKEIRKEFPDVPLMADANSAYTMDNLDTLQRLDDYGLLMIEEPFPARRFLDYQKLQRLIQTPICLDESISSLNDCLIAHHLESGKIINIKVGRVGGITEAVNIHDFCFSNQIPVWCGGMLETGVGRAFNIALASLEQFTIPGDISASKRYWVEDIITPEIVVKNGQIDVSTEPGIGVNIDRNKLKKYRVDHMVFNYRMH